MPHSSLDLEDGEEFYDDDTTNRAAPPFATEEVTPTPIGAGGGPTVRAVTLGALSVPVPKSRVIQEQVAPAPKNGQVRLVLVGAALGALVTLLLSFGAYLLLFR